jgi:predicted PurR-regulated permease PerM
MISPEMIKKYPFYLKATVILFGIVLFVYILFNLRDILVPLSFALLLAILLNPIVALLEKWRFPKVLAIIASILLAMILIVAITYFLFLEIKSFSDQLPAFKEKMASLFSKVQHMARSDFGINTKKQNEYLNEAENGLRPFLASAMGNVMGILSMFFLLPIYAFLFLFYKNLILAFLFQVFEKAEEKQVSVVLTQTKGAIQSYMYGLLLEALIVASLNTIALLILGIQYAVLLGVLGALLNILPFIGGILAVLFPILIATVTKDGFQSEIWIIIAYIVIQFVDNHFLVPYIVASKVKINALISIVVVLLGGALWGFSGMFLSIPFIGVLKIIFDKMPELKPWGMLIGTETPTKRKNKLASILKRSQPVLP